MARLATGQTISPEGTAMAARKNRWSVLDYALKAHHDLVIVLWTYPVASPERDRLLSIDATLHEIIEDYERRGMVAGEEAQDA